MSNAVQAPPAAAWPELYRLSTLKYEEMIEADVFGPDDKVELIHGRLVRKLPSSPLHNGVLLALTVLLGRLCGTGFCLRGQMGLTLQGNSVPEPDLAIVRGAYRDFFTTQATATDTELVVEVSKSSLAFDLGDKMRVYAAAGIPAYWVVDAEAAQVHVHSQPQPGGYAAVAVAGVSDELPVTLEGEIVGTLPVKEFLP